MSRFAAILITVLCLVIQFNVGKVGMKFSPADQRLISLPKASSAPIISLGHPRSLGNWYWIQTVLYFGRYWLSAPRMKPVEKALNLEVDLAPYSEEIAFFGGWIMCSHDDTCEGISNFARRVAVNNQYSWKSLRDLAIVVFMEQRDYSLAEGLLKVAATRPGAPLAELKQIEGYVITRSGQEAQAEAYYANLYQNAPTDQLRVRAALQLKRYTMVKHLRLLQAALVEYVDAYNTLPKGVADLINFKGTKLPEKDPFGGKYVIGDGVIESTTKDQHTLIVNKYMDKNPLKKVESRTYLGPEPPQNLKAVEQDPLQQKLDQLP